MLIHISRAMVPMTEREDGKKDRLVMTEGIGMLEKKIGDRTAIVEPEVVADLQLMIEQETEIELSEKFIGDESSLTKQGWQLRKAPIFFYDSN